MTWLDLVAEEIPELPEEERGYVLWNCTGFPEFWHPEDGTTPEECCRTQLRRVRATLEAEREMIASLARAEGEPE